MKNHESYATTGLRINIVVQNCVTSAETDVKVICLKPTLMQDETKFDRSGRKSGQIRPVDLNHTVNVTDNFDPGERL